MQMCKLCGRQEGHANSCSKFEKSMLNWKAERDPYTKQWEICCRKDKPCKEHIIMPEEKVAVLLQLNKKLDSKASTRNIQYAAYGEALYTANNTANIKAHLDTLTREIRSLETAIEVVKAL